VTVLLRSEWKQNCHFCVEKPYHTGRGGDEDNAAYNLAMKDAAVSEPPSDTLLAVYAVATIQRPEIGRCLQF